MCPFKLTPRIAINSGAVQLREVGVHSTEKHLPFQLGAMNHYQRSSVVECHCLYCFKYLNCIVGCHLPRGTQTKPPRTCSYVLSYHALMAAASSAKALRGTAQQCASALAPGHVASRRCRFTFFHIRRSVDLLKKTLPLQATSEAHWIHGSCWIMAPKSGTRSLMPWLRCIGSHLYTNK